MAADTQNQRASAVGFVTPWGVTYPAPDGDLSTQADRQHIAASYSGLLAGDITITPGDVPIVDVTVTASGGLITAVAPKAGVDRLNGLTTMDGSPLVHMSGEKWATMSSEVGAGGLVTEATAGASDGMITDVTPSAEDN